jgi:predicted nucleic acid-binding Zn ribbon protein
MIERLGSEVRRELDRLGPQGQIAEVVAAWPSAVGPAIARNAWPARIARDGTLHVATRDAIWAFELGHRAAEIAGAAGVPAVRFAAGPMPDARPADPSGESLRHAPEPGAEDRRQAAAAAASIEDADLRALVERAAAASLASRPSSRRFW